MPDLIRRAAPDDTETVVELVAEFCAIDGHPFDPDMVRRALGPLVDEGPEAPGLILLATRDLIADGYAVLTWGYSLESGGREALLDEIYLRTRRQGAGRLLLEAVLDEARAAGARRIFLETERGNRLVRRFYERAGFAADDSIWMSRSLF